MDLHCIVRCGCALVAGLALGCGNLLEVDRYHLEEPDPGQADGAIDASSDDGVASEQTADCQGKCDVEYKACVTGGTAIPDCDASYQKCLSDCETYPECLALGCTANCCGVPDQMYCQPDPCGSGQDAGNTVGPMCGGATCDSAKEECCYKSEAPPADPICVPLKSAPCKITTQCYLDSDCQGAAMCCFVPQPDHTACLNDCGSQGMRTCKDACQNATCSKSEFFTSLGRGDVGVCSP